MLALKEQNMPGRDGVWGKGIQIFRTNEVVPQIESPSRGNWVNLKTIFFSRTSNRNGTIFILICRFRFVQTGFIGSEPWSRNVDRGCNDENVKNCMNHYYDMYIVCRMSVVFEARWWQQWENKNKLSEMKTQLHCAWYTLVL